MEKLIARVALQLLLLTGSSCAFELKRIPPVTRRRHARVFARQIQPLPTTETGKFSMQSLQMTSNDDGSVNWVRQNNFNPFDYQTSAPTRGATSPSSSFTSQSISYRKMQMQQVFNDLLDAVGSRRRSTRKSDDEDDEDILASILLENKDVVLEPLEDDDAFLDADSVIRPGMARPERYRVYLQSLDTRIAAAKNNKVKAVLEAIRDFVRRHE